MRSKKPTRIEIYDRPDGSFSFRPVCPNNKKTYGHAFDKRAGALTGARKLIAALRGPVEIVHLQRAKGDFAKGKEKYLPVPLRPNEYIAGAARLIAARLNQETYDEEARGLPRSRDV